MNLMRRPPTGVELAVMGLAAWRLSSLLGNVDEHGPYDALTQLRAAAGVVFGEDNIPTYDPLAPRWKQELTKGILCHWCNSVWIGGAIGVAYAILPTVTVTLCLPFALSTLVIIAMRMIDSSPALH